MSDFHHGLLAPTLPPGLFPTILASGSSEAGLEATRTMGALAVRYPKPPGEEDVMPADSPGGYGVRVGIVARESATKRGPSRTSASPKIAKGSSSVNWRRR